MYRSLATADYAVEQLQKAGIDAWRHQNSITVVFPKPPPSILKKWILAPYEDICHLITVPSVDRKTIDLFVEDFKNALRSREEN